MTRQVHAGAFEASGISGVALACGSDAMGIRLAYPHITLGLFDGKDVVLSMDDCVAAPDQSYARVSWRVPVTPAAIKKFASFPRGGVNAPLVCEYGPGESVRITLEWRFNGSAVTGRYSADGPVRVGLFVNGCFAPARVVRARRNGCELKCAARTLKAAFAGKLGNPFLLDSRLQAEQVWAGFRTVLPIRRRTSQPAAMAFYPVELSPGSPLHFAMVLAEGKAPLPKVLPAEIDEDIAAGHDVYEMTRMYSEGGLIGAAEAVGSLAAYSRAYDPVRRRVQTTVNRTWCGPNSPGLVFGWDNFFTSYIAAWEDPRLGAQSLEHAVQTYGERGATPAGIASGPVQRNLIIPVMYCRTLDVLDDADLARRTWPTMMAFMRFWFADRGDGHPWRDGNDDGLIESGTSLDFRRHPPGSIVQNAMDETGYDDLPVYSAGFADGRYAMPAPGAGFDFVRKTLTVTLVCQNSLYRVSCLAMARWAGRLGKAGDATWLRAEAGRIAARMKKRLLAADGIFRDRFWSGEFLPVEAMTVFYPLLAGVADDRVKKHLRKMLLDPKQFWGDNVIPTVSRDDPAYCDGLDHAGNYWRGNIWPPAAYIVYLAIKEAGWDDIAAEYAKRTCRQFMGYWQKHFHAYENYPPEGAVDHRFLYVSPWGGREVRYVWAAMMVFCGLEEVFAPEVTRPGLRFGNPDLAEASWDHLKYAGRAVRAAAGAEMTSVLFGDEWSFRAEPGVVVREFQRVGNVFRFRMVSRARTRVILSSSDFRAMPRVTVNGQAHTAYLAHGMLIFSVPRGRHDVVIG